MLKIQAAEEAIWHFAGIFQIADQRGRMWVEYDRIAAHKSDIEPSEIIPLDVVTPHPYAIPDYIPDIPYTPPGMVMDQIPLVYSAFYDNLSGPLYFTAPLEETQAAGLVGAVSALRLRPPVDPPELIVEPPDPPDPPEPPDPPDAAPTLPAPGSVALIVVSQLWLRDDDILDAQKIEGGVVSLMRLDAKMMDLAQQADQLGIALRPDLPADEMAFRDIAVAFRDMELPEQTIPDATVFICLGTDPEGWFLNGEAVTEAPKLDELLPLYRLEKKAEAEREAEEQAEAKAAKISKDGPTSAGPDGGVITVKADAAHDLILGNNTLVNEVSISAAWIAAPVIATGLGVYSYNIVSQTNVWSDQDTLTGLSAEANGAAPTTSLNYATYQTFSNPIAPRGGGDGDAPQFWVTATLKGSLINANWIDQYNLVTDNDMVSVTLNAAETLLLMGENNSLDKISLNELGTQFDVILIDGYVINLNAVIQKNVMVDDDRIMAKGGTEVSVSSGDNLLMNSSTIVQAGKPVYKEMTSDMGKMMAKAGDGPIGLPQSLLNDPALQGLDGVRVLHIQGDMVSLNMIRQTNVLGDSDQVQVFRDQLLEQGGAIKLIAGSNLLMNQATIVEAEYDATIYSGGEIYTDALLYQAELVATDDPLAPSGTSDLASEAVLFLADGMLSDAPEDAEFRPIGADSAISPDAMETVLT